MGSKVNESDTILKVFYNDKEKFDEAFEYIKDAIVIENLEDTLGEALSNKPHILDII